MTLTSWIQQHLWSLIIAFVALVSQYAVYGYKTVEIERRVILAESQIMALNTQQVQTQIGLAQIAVDLSYIKTSLDRVLK